MSDITDADRNSGNAAGAGDTLTDAEREAVTWAAITADSEYDSRRAATLRGLLERQQGGGKR